MTPAFKTYGITGSFGCGKSTVAGILAEHLNAPVIDTDRLAKEYLQNDPDVYRRLRELFGDAVLDDEARIDTKKVAEVVFADRAKLKELEGLLHPLVISYVQKAKIKENRHNHLIVEAPMMIESGLHREMDTLIVVVADHAHTFDRLQKKGFEKAEINSRLLNQLSQDEKKKYADIIIENNGNIQTLESEVKKIG